MLGSSVALSSLQEPSGQPSGLHEVPGSTARPAAPPGQRLGIYSCLKTTYRARQHSERLADI